MTNGLNLVFLAINTLMISVIPIRVAEQFPNTIERIRRLDENMATVLDNQNKIMEKLKIEKNQKK